MEITITDSLLLGMVLAFLALGYINKRTATAQASRALVRDHMKGDRHIKQENTMKTLRSRLSLQSSMIILASSAVFLAFASTVCVIYDQDSAAKLTFVISIAFGMFSLLQAIREISIANKSHFGELDATVAKDDPYYQTAP